MKYCAWSLWNPWRSEMEVLDWPGCMLANVMNQLCFWCFHAGAYMTQVCIGLQLGAMYLDFPGRHRYPDIYGTINGICENGSMIKRWIYTVMVTVAVLGHDLGVSQQQYNTVAWRDFAHDGTGFCFPIHFSGLRGHYGYGSDFHISMSYSIFWIGVIISKIKMCLLCSRPLLLFQLVCVFHLR